MVSFNETSLQLQISVPTTTRAGAHKYAPAARFKIGRFYIKNSKNYYAGSTANAKWTIAGGTANMVTSSFKVYVNSKANPQPLISPTSYYVLGNRQL